MYLTSCPWPQLAKIRIVCHRLCRVRIFDLLFLLEFIWLQPYLILLDASNGHCISPGKMVSASYTHGVIIIISDFVLSILPIFMVKDLNMPARLKIWVMAIFSLGLLYVLFPRLSTVLPFFGLASTPVSKFH